MSEMEPYFDGEPWVPGVDFNDDPEPETPEQRKALGHKDACYTRHELAPGIHQDVPHLHERIDL